MSDTRHVVVEHPDLAGSGGRAPRCTVHVDSLPTWTAIGWTPVGPCEGAHTTETLEERDARLAAQAADAAAALHIVDTVDDDAAEVAAVTIPAPRTPATEES